MVTRRKWKEYWTESKRVIIGKSGTPEVKQVTCCCSVAATDDRMECARARSNKTPCRCFCHSKEPK